MTLDELGKDKRAAILAIAARHGVERVRVFGSFARGEASEDSDLDLLIEAGPRTPPWFPGGLLFDLEEELTLCFIRRRSQVRVLSRPPFKLKDF